MNCCPMNRIENIDLQEMEVLNLLLQSARLPEVDTSNLLGQYFKISDPQGNITAAIGLEQYGEYGLLRSLVVGESYRNRGLAGMLVRKVIEHSTVLGLKKLILLTTTADVYFEKHQFERIQRDDVPEEIKQSTEFSSICPVSAIVMQKKL
jgi:amino-acid N-acetyltransferase